MIKSIQARPQWQRVIIFILLVVLVIIAICAVTLAVAWYSINGTPRIKSVSMNDAFTVREFAQLPDDAAHPAALALAPDGTLYTGSYVTGAVWSITPEGVVTELAGSEEAIGSVTGLTLLPDGTLLVLDRIKPLHPMGAHIWRIPANGTPEKWIEVDTAENTILYDMVADAESNVYITAILNGAADEVLRFTPDGTQSVWWTAPETATITGLAYDGVREALVVVDTSQSSIYEVPFATPASAEILYQHTDKQNVPNFDGVTVVPDGTLYLAALGLNRVAHLEAATGELTYLAAAFRGSSRVAYDAERQRLYVNNWEQRSLLPERLVIIDIDVLPRLPFTIDVVEPVNAD